MKTIVQMIEDWKKIGDCHEFIREANVAHYDEALSMLEEIMIYLPELKQGDCFCAVGIGHPAYRDHAQICHGVMEWAKKAGME